VSATSAWLERLGAVHQAQDNTQHDRLNLQRRRHALFNKPGAEAESAALDVAIADLHTTLMDLQIAQRVATGTDITTLDANGRDLGMTWTRVGGPSPYLPDNPRWWATTRQLAADEHTDLGAYALAGGDLR
jgi:hypothetical protein